MLNGNYRIPNTGNTDIAAIMEGRPDITSFRRR
jgi:hypothetical protein